MHFTREPIVETVITPREGCRIILRNSKGNSQEEYAVEAVEVVSFGSALFFRCLEKPKAFLLPVSDYEVLETKETRVILKSISLEKSIKIGGGREAPLRTKESSGEKEEENGAREETAPRAETTDQKVDKRRDRLRNRRRRSSEERHEMKEWTEKQKDQESAESPAPVVQSNEEGGDAPDETLPPVSSPMLTSLIPPPSTLISETLARYKDAPYAEAAFFSKSLGKTSEEKEDAASESSLQIFSSSESDEASKEPVSKEKGQDEAQPVPQHTFEEES